ncbi:hypothetical protein BKA58DRAFT_196178 [Alternaria rosae]|uniref:uncharacterized protein n=1 Tax=Alternaria rosae TaxID=1187941 RepID=UPI001E8DB613|nr:uncharacterized protein BKA58DRAFT_196178 [Alternaria rosae]KAH6868512.1 hypothetical protein BKA58DRAFT_196178 [Alternaria rosae]
MASKAPRRTTARELFCPSLPAEVWINVFRYHTDLAHLWNVVRRVSPTLRACVEHAFGEHFLKEIHIDFQLEKYNLGGKSKRPEVSTRLARRGKGKDKLTAWFKDERPDPGSEKAGGKKDREHYHKVTRRWEENVKNWKAEMPNYTISIGDLLVNDTELPDLSIDVAAREINFNWKNMLQLFFREQERLRILKDEWHIKTAKKIQANNARLKKGEKLMPSDYPPPWSTAEAEIRKDIRRARLKEHYRDDEQMVWAIDSLKHFEQYGAAAGSAKALKLNPDLPGAGLGEKWFGSVNLVQELYLDEWSCMHRIDTKVEHIRNGT